jgi:hypothetical protein
MVRFQRRIPLGLSDEFPPPAGIAPSAGCWILGPLGIAADEATAWAHLRRSGVEPERVAALSVIITFSVDSDTYRLRTLGPVWDATWYEEIIRPAEARRIIETVIVHVADAAVVSLLQNAVPRLSGLYPQGDLLLVRLRRRETVRAGSQAPQIDTPRPSRQPAPAPPPIEEPPMAADIAADQAQALRNAAESGVPFCEECERAAAARQAAAAGA